MVVVFLLQSLRTINNISSSPCYLWWFFKDFSGRHSFLGLEVYTLERKTRYNFKGFDSMSPLTTESPREQQSLSAVSWPMDTVEMACSGGSDKRLWKRVWVCPNSATYYCRTTNKQLPSLSLCLLLSTTRFFF